jgi:hypothetical protein
VPTLHIHLDEAGNWEFSPKGSKYFVIAAAWTYDPQPLAHALTALRFRLIRSGVNIDSFHAAPDQQATRDLVVQTMLAHDGWRFAAIVMEKCKINPVLRDPQHFYPKFAGSLLKFVLRGRRRGPTERVLVYADTIPMDTIAKREGVIKAMKLTCAAELDATVERHVFSHRRESNKWLQVVDYCCWSVQRKWERSETRTYTQLWPRIAATELNLTQRGDQTDYY